MDKITLLEIIRLGLNKEKDKSKFYGRMKAICKRERVIQLFDALESWEKSHVELFGKIEKKLIENKKEIALNIQEQEEYIYAILLEYEDLGKFVEQKHDKCAIPLAMHSEKNSILFFEIVKEIMPHEYKETVDKILREEKEHLNYLYKMQKELDRFPEKP